MIRQFRLERFAVVVPHRGRRIVVGLERLAAAIPAVIAYNLIIGSIREMASRNDDFALEMLNMVERQTQTGERSQIPVGEARR